MPWGWVFGGLDERGRFQYHPQLVAEIDRTIHVVENGATLCGRAAQPAYTPRVMCTCESCAWEVAQRSGVWRMPRRVAGFVQRAYIQMYVWPEQRRAEIEFERLSRR